MDAYIFDNFKIEKANAMLRYRRLRHVANLFRFLEICLVLIFLSWISSRLPFILKISGEYFRQLISFIISPLFIFLLSNVIVLILLAKSGQLTGQSSSVKKSDTEFYEEFTKNIEKSVNCSSVSEPEEEIVYQDKQMIIETNTVISELGLDSTGEVTLLPDQSVPKQKVFQRSQSENLKREKQCGKLRRSETEKCRKIGSSDGTTAETKEFVDELSNEEFQRTIEAFIERQLRFHKEEKLAIVPRV